MCVYLYWSAEEAADGIGAAAAAAGGGGAAMATAGQVVLRRVGVGVWGGGRVGVQPLAVLGRLAARSAAVAAATAALAAATSAASGAVSANNS